ncbi:MAG TPA: phosphatase PAP2 family protein [Fimbriimonadaceae bacterium]|nr:phosphatase PAP2 family protein [Fimbriimonadaceae bacterium]
MASPIKPALQIGLALIACGPAAFAQTWPAQFASGPGAIGYVAIGVTLPLLRDGRLSKGHFWRGCEALGATITLTEALKAATHVPRPDSGTHDSFPSGHASATFCVATMESQFHPKEAPFWYAGAALIADSRLVLNRHRPSDVIAGAALGYLTARAELSSRHGWVIAPLIGGDGTYGLMASKRF